MNVQSMDRVESPLTIERDGNGWLLRMSGRSDWTWEIWAKQWIEWQRDVDEWAGSGTQADWSSQQPEWPAAGALEATQHGDAVSIVVRCSQGWAPEKWAGAWAAMWLWIRSRSRPGGSRATP